MDAAIVGTMNSGDVSLLQLPIQWGANPSVLHKRTGTTALWTAIFWKSEVALKGLLDLPVDACIRSKEGQLAIDYAREIDWQVGLAILESYSSCSE
jgi:hypothetical protein